MALIGAHVTSLQLPGPCRPPSATEPLRGWELAFPGLTSLSFLRTPSVSEIIPQHEQVLLSDAVDHLVDRIAVASSRLCELELSFRSFETRLQRRSGEFKFLTSLHILAPQRRPYDFPEEHLDNLRKLKALSGLPLRAVTFDAAWINLILTSKTSSISESTTKILSFLPPAFPLGGVFVEEQGCIVPVLGYLLRQAYLPTDIDYLISNMNHRAQLKFSLTTLGYIVKTSPFEQSPRTISALLDCGSDMLQPFRDAEGRWSNAFLLAVETEEPTVFGGLLTRLSRNSTNAQIVDLIPHSHFRHFVTLLVLEREQLGRFLPLLSHDALSLGLIRLCQRLSSQSDDEFLQLQESLAELIRAGADVNWGLAAPQTRLGWIDTEMSLALAAAASKRFGATARFLLHSGARAGPIKLGELFLRYTDYALDEASDIFGMAFKEASVAGDRPALGLQLMAKTVVFARGKPLLNAPFTHIRDQDLSIAPFFDAFWVSLPTDWEREPAPLLNDGAVRRGLLSAVIGPVWLKMSYPNRERISSILCDFENEMNQDLLLIAVRGCFAIPPNPAGVVYLKRTAQYFSAATSLESVGINLDSLLWDTSMLNAVSCQALVSLLERAQTSDYDKPARENLIWRMMNIPLFTQAAGSFFGTAERRRRYFLRDDQQTIVFAVNTGFPVALRAYLKTLSTDDKENAFFGLTEKFMLLIIYSSLYPRERPFSAVEKCMYILFEAGYSAEEFLGAAMRTDLSVATKEWQAWIGSQQAALDYTYELDQASPAS